MLSFLVQYVGVSHKVSILLDSFQIFPALLFESLLSPLLFDFFQCLRMYYSTVLSTLRVLTHFFFSQHPLRKWRHKEFVVVVCSNFAVISMLWLSSFLFLWHYHSVLIIIADIERLRSFYFFLFLFFPVYFSRWT